MGTGCSGGPANAPIIFCCLLMIACLPLGIRCEECRVQACSHEYTSSMEAGGVSQGATARYCALLRGYASCVRATARACRGDLAYHTVQSLIAKWTRAYACDANTSPPRPPQPQPPPRRPARPPAECAGLRARAFRHCALFGDPHLRTFFDELQTCAAPGAWPLLDNPHLAVQVTNERVAGGTGATAIAKVTVIVRQHGPCAVEKTYEAQTDFLPGVFADGSRSSGPGVRIREESPGRHVEIHLRYIATRVVVRQVGRYLTFAVRMPSSVAVQGAQGHTLELCVRGCPRRERIDFGRVLETDGGPKREALAACRALNVTDFYLDACVFDLLTTGDGSFSAAARDAMLDAGHVPIANATEAKAAARRPTAAWAALLLALLLEYLYVHSQCYFWLRL